jgi:hypothetical protein
VKRALPYLVAFAVPAVTLAVAYSAIGASAYSAAVGGVLLGVIGSSSHALAELVRRWQTPRVSEAEIEEVARQLYGPEDLFQPWAPERHDEKLPHPQPQERDE